MPTKETYAGTLHRMHAKARTEGIRLLHDAGDDRWFATSTRDAAAWYQLDDTGCTCAGWLRFGYCKHWAAYLAATNQIPAIDDPMAAPEYNSWPGDLAKRVSDELAHAAYRAYGPRQPLTADEWLERRQEAIQDEAATGQAVAHA